MSEGIIVSKKREIDEQHGMPTIVGKKCNNCGQIHPIVRYFWHLDVRGEPSLRINLLAPTPKDLDRIFEVEHALQNLGVHFDTGYGGGRDWEFDWSLTGEHYLRTNRKVKCKPIEGYTPLNRHAITDKHRITRKLLVRIVNLLLFWISRISYYSSRDPEKWPIPDKEA